MTHPPDPIKLAKAGLRKEALALRDALPVETIAESMMEHLKQWPRFQQARAVLFYAAFRREVDLSPLCALSPEKAWYLPAVLPSHEMVFRRVTAETPMWAGAYGIPEPPETATPWSEDNNSTLLLVPGLLFDRQGYRLGYGKGYYDRFLSRTEIKALAESGTLQPVGVVPQALLHAELPHAEWDLPMNFLLTEQGIIPISKS